MNNYSVHLTWSDEDKAYLAIIPELPGCMADGETREEALQNIAIICDQWIETARDEARPIPAPLSIQDMARLHEESQRQLALQVQKAIQDAVNQIVSQLQVGAEGSLHSRFSFVPVSE